MQPGPFTSKTCLQSSVHLRHDTLQLFTIIDTPGLGFDVFTDQYHISLMYQTLLFTKNRVNVIVWVINGRVLRQNNVNQLIIETILRMFPIYPWDNLVLAVQDFNCSVNDNSRLFPSNEEIVNFYSLQMILTLGRINLNIPLCRFDLSKNLTRGSTLWRCINTILNKVDENKVLQVVFNDKEWLNDVSNYKYLSGRKLHNTHKQTECEVTSVDKLMAYVFVSFLLGFFTFTKILMLMKQC